jgi:ketosteroid isomerase-like protein
MFVSCSLATFRSTTPVDRPKVSMKIPPVSVVLIGCLAVATSAWAGPEEESVEQTIRAAAKSVASFSESRDKESILKFYSLDYRGIQDGESEGRDAIERWLSDYEAELNGGSTLRFISAVSDLEVQVTGSTAWATYDYVFQAIRKGELEGQDSGKCTSLLRKEGPSWVIFHEHCSKTRSRT